MLSLSQRIPLQRLRQMRENRNEIFTTMPRLHDNCLRNAILSLACLRRIKHAGLIGKFYWRRDRVQPEVTSPQDADWASGMLNYDAQKEQPYLQLMRQDPDLCGGLDFAQIGMAMGMELDCFTTFLAGSVQDETTGGYQLKQAFMEIPAPLMATSITINNIKTIAQTMISMPVMVTQPETEARKPAAAKSAPKKRASRAKKKVVAAEVAEVAEVEKVPEVDASEIAEILEAANTADFVDVADVVADAVASVYAAANVEGDAVPASKNAINTAPAKKVRKAKVKETPVVAQELPTEIETGKAKKAARSKKRLESAS